MAQPSVSLPAEIAQDHQAEQATPPVPLEEGVNDEVSYWFFMQREPTINLDICV